MTIYFYKSQEKTQIKQDFFVLREPAGKEDTYHFSGASLVGGKYELNSIDFARYYALDPQSGIRVERDRVSLVQYGKEIAVVPGNFAEHVQPPGIWESAEDLEQDSSSASLFPCYRCWIRIKQHLRDQSPDNATAAWVLSEITKWESCSIHTLQLVRDMLTKKAPHLNSPSNEIYVAGQQWLVHGFIWNTIIMGSEEGVWGIVNLKGQNTQLSFMVAPLHNGWAIRFHGSGFFVVKDKYQVNVQPVAIPVGSWSRYGSWVFWPQIGDIFLPDQRLIPGVVSMRHKMIGATQNLAFLSPIPVDSYFKSYGERQIFSLWQNESRINTNFITVVNRLGERTPINTEQRYGQAPDFYFGNESVFVLKKLSQDYFLTIEDASGQLPLPQPRELRLFSSEKYEIDKAHVVAGSPDIFIILFTSYPSTTNYLGLISASGKALLLPQGLYNPWPRGCAIFMEQVDNIIHICFVDSPEKQPEPIVTLEILKNDRFRVLLGPDTVVEKGLRKIPLSSLGMGFEDLIKGQPPKQKRIIQIRRGKEVEK